MSRWLAAVQHAFQSIEGGIRERERERETNKKMCSFPVHLNQYDTV